MHLNSRLIFEKHALRFFRAGQSVLELGADGNPSTYERLVPPGVNWSKAELRSSLDQGVSRFGTVESTALAIVMDDEYKIPVDDGTFDVVVAGQVIEHVRKPWIWVRDLARITKPGGLVVLVAPVSWGYHEAPIDCWRLYPEAMRALCEEASLTPVVVATESLEPAPRRRYFGESFGPPAGAKRQLLRRLGWPQPVALDTILVARR